MDKQIAFLTHGVQLWVADGVGCESRYWALLVYTLITPLSSEVDRSDYTQSHIQKEWK
jgi:hypothetical protein